MYKLTKNKIVKTALLIIAAVLTCHILFYLSLIIFPVPDILKSDFSDCYYYSNGKIAWIKLNDNDQYRINVRIKDASSYLKKGIVNYEDKHFYFHPGFNPVSIARALYYNLKSGRIISGGSTITMQLARLCEPKKRTVFNKLLEILRAMQYEAVFSKSKILEFYLNIIPMGGNIQGVEAASFFYFGKTSGLLTFSESSLLIGISNSPETNRPDLKNENALKIRKKTAVKNAALFKINNNELDKILSEPIPDTKTFFDYDIAPLIERFNKLPHRDRRVLTLDRDIQALCLNILKDNMRKIDLANGALIVIDNKTMNVLAYIGSPYFNSGNNSVKFNACSIRRSPGSTLKPLIYALSLEKGLITQKKRIYDIPMDFGGYKPKNFTNKYYGIIPADEALYRSLNIPAIYLESRLGENNLKQTLNRCSLLKISDRIDNNDLSLVLGSHPLTLENITEIYAMLANKGRYNRLNFFQDQRPDISKGRKILTEESAYIISEILSEGYRPDLNACWEYTKSKAKISYKTGTSYGFIDAWAIGYTPDYTVGVWVGNLDNKFNKVITGINSSAPVLFKIMNELCKENDSWFNRPEGVLKRNVCALSGMPPGKYCSDTIEELYIKEKSLYETCNVHKKVYVDKKTKIASSLENIKNPENYEERIIAVWPEDVDNYIKSQGKDINEQFSGSYSDVYLSDNIRIISPDDKIKYVINLNEEIDFQKIMLKANLYSDSENLYWYVNDRFTGCSKNGETLFFQPEEKKNKISVTDEKGRSGEVNIVVSFVK